MLYQVKANQFKKTAESSTQSDENLLRSYQENSADTLVIHPSDPTTAFLSAIYQEKGWDVVTDRSPHAGDLAQCIAAHNRIVMLGHGSEQGLFGGGGFIVHAALAPMLREKKTICIWCNADRFVEEHGLNGFYSGMFISEVIEANMFGITETTEQEIQLSNDLFASVLGKYVDFPGTLENVKKEYQTAGDPIVAFNSNRLYCNAKNEGNPARRKQQNSKMEESNE